MIWGADDELGVKAKEPKMILVDYGGPRANKAASCRPSAFRDHRGEPSRGLPERWDMRFWEISHLGDWGYQMGTDHNGISGA